ncbi:hypothetical protein [Phreatobacter oligotrophus]|uniref:Uncharacterized protein n=1 Tax=Phreatobacter oligotrophus TaxID=1122261 RepID=A0A2T4YZ99_9HYPH|nr:hypothetical protein [Phreatobacter oligotrophus]PTM52297.1 hypothetical protein C8P69_10897 [Phreatobacter oligotrophus]
MVRVIILAIAAAALAGCSQTASRSGYRAVDPNAPIAPGAVRIAERPIDPDKWAMRGGVLRLANRPPQRATLHVCRPAACAEPAFAVVVMTPGAPRAPDREALKRIATEQIPSQNELNQLIASANPSAAASRVVSSNVATLKGQPGIVMEIERRAANGGRTVHQFGGFAFAGGMMISVQSYSTDREFARRNRDLILERIDIREGPRVDTGTVVETTVPATPAAPAPTPPAAPQRL